MSQNPGQSSEAEKPAPGVATIVTKEFLEDLAANPSKAATLDRATRKEVLRQMADNEVDDAAPVQDAPVEKDPEVKKAPDAKADGNGKTDLPVSVQEARKRHQELSDEANKYEQKLAAAEARAAKARKAFEDIQKAESKPPEDYLDDKYQTDLKSRLEKTEKQLGFLQNLLEERDKEEISTLVSQKHTKEEDKIFSEIDALQTEFDELKTAKPFKQLNNEYAAWVSDMVKTSGHTGDLTSEVLNAVSNRYDTDEVFRNQVRSKPPEDLDKLRVILRLHHQKAQEGGSYMANYLAALHKDGVLTEVMQRGRKEAAKDAAHKTVQAMKRQQDELTTLSPNEGAGGKGPDAGEMTAQAAWAFLEAIQLKLQAGSKLTPEERAKSKLIRETFGRQEA